MTDDARGDDLPPPEALLGRVAGDPGEDSPVDRSGPAVRTALACLRAGIEAAMPEAVIRESVALEGDALRVADATYDLGDHDEVLVVGGGKAAGGVADALVDLLGDRLDDGVVVVPGAVGDEAEPDGPGGDGSSDPIDRVAGGHPVPTPGSVAGGERVLELAEGADERTLVLTVVTGGASALLAAPAAGVDLPDLRETTDALLSAGVDIDGVNAVRKHLSRVKGGRLASAAAPATVVGLLFSDVVGDDPAVIGSGPVSPDPTEFADALAVLDRHGVDAPQSVRARLESGARGETPETPGAEDPAFARVSTHVLADGRTAIDAAAGVARDRGYDALVVSSRLRGEARECGTFHVGIAEEVATAGDPVAPPAVLLSGGETTVTVAGDGEGGPNAECALAAGVDLVDRRSPLSDRDGDCAFLAVDTDGRDGSTDAAGALVTPDSVADAEAALAALDDNDAVGYFREAGGLVITGPTGTNVDDLRVLVVEE
ncbi:DUF4147 domain-containing protein (plasmid) [Halobaculum sp. CBA1158]|uniref:glycerate kinase type-2 family protein n=1 Tax=Halobaculum sp. CBA1158 TaxID=2904243 RepID=UPI001F474F8F|nr:DUF4147 domain-containing protein [Halobaculum sp. CBA1158]UIP01353.1 DUF4147 domain-containing protein [Halobaculum sp. CBA1158]